MEISNYYTSVDDVVSFTEQRASDFAKAIAGDFNPIHDPGGKRFCVPGDLLFAVILLRFGVAENTEIHFAGLLTADNTLSLPPSVDESQMIKDNRERDVLNVLMSGTRYTDYQLINNIATAYVRFSGKTFPDILVPLMRESNVMINPQRPLVIYKDMSISLNSDTTEIDSTNIELNLDHADLIPDGRKGSVTLTFRIDANGQKIGEGRKNMLLSGLREFDEDAMRGVVDEYNTHRAQYAETKNAV